VFIAIFCVVMRGAIIATAVMRITVIIPTEMMEEVLDE
jgi:hypothetical protein